MESLVEVRSDHVLLAGTVSSMVDYPCPCPLLHGDVATQRGELWIGTPQRWREIRRLFRRLGHPAGFRDTLPPPQASASGTALRRARRGFSGSGVHGPGT